MKLVYLAHIGLRDDWAQTVQVMKMSEAFAFSGAEVLLIVPKRNFSNKLDPFIYYGISPNFRIVELPFIDFFTGTQSIFFYWVRFLSFLFVSRVYLFFVSYDVLYTREIYFVPFFRNIFLERHSFPHKIKKIHTYIFKKVLGLVVLTTFIRERVLSFVDTTKIYVAPDAVRLEEFADMTSLSDARSRFALSQESHIFGYIGTLKTMNTEKGVATAIDALCSLPVDYLLYVVGGEKHDIDFYRTYSIKKDVGERVVFAGKVPHKDIPLHISVCDVLVAPFPDIEHYRYFMSPLKIFEYMASRRPMVVTDLPSLREILVDGETAVFVPPGDAHALADAITGLIAHPERAQNITENAYREVVEKYTWKKRAENILKFIQS